MQVETSILDLKEPKFGTDDFCPPLQQTEQSSYYLNNYIELINTIEGFKHESVHSGGAADINHFSHPEVVAFDGLGAIGGNLHRKDEFIITSSLETRSLAFGKFLLILNEEMRRSVC